MNINNAVNSVLRLAGHELKESRRLPVRNILGLKNINFQTILDVGANTGQFAKQFRMHFPKTRIHSFEPIPSCFKALQTEASMDGSWKCHNFALGSRTGNVEFFLHVAHTPSSSFLQTTETVVSMLPQTKEQEVVNIECQRLDEWMNDHVAECPPEVLLKLDVQGFESEVLEGASDTLGIVEAVICEVNVKPLYKHQSLFSEIVRKLDEYSLCFHGVLEHGFDSNCNVNSFDAVFIKRH